VCSSDLVDIDYEHHANAPQNAKEAGEQQATAQACQPQKDAASTH
jgi:hypothetical protein